MKLQFGGARISGNLVVLPETERRFEDDVDNFDFPRERSLKLKQAMGYDRRRVAGPGTCISDLAVHGFETLRSRGWLDPQSIDALIVVTQTPDYWIPPTSCVIHGRARLRQDVVCLDVTQGCAGFVIGLMEAMNWLRQPSVRRVALVTADVMTRKISPRDRNSLPLAGDAAAITLVEADAAAAAVHARLRFDGTRSAALQIPAGGCRLPASAETAVLSDPGDRNWRALDHLRMDGTAVFNFVMNEVPGQIEQLLADAGLGRDDIAWYFFHQPNPFMLRKLAERLRVPAERVPDWVTSTWGNSNSVTIPAVIAGTLKERALGEDVTCCLAGFGVGLTWGGLVMPIGRMQFNEAVDRPET
jgi:3-oxoacyl-[acyl-carrier-protein] synthase III